MQSECLLASVPSKSHNYSQIAMINPRNFISNHARHSSKLDDLLDEDPFSSFAEFPSPPPRDDGPLRRQLSKAIRQSLQISNSPRTPAMTYSENSEFSMDTSSSSSSYSYSLNDHRDYRPMTPPRISSLDFKANTKTSKPQKQLLSPLNITSDTRRPVSPTKEKLSHVSKSLLSFMGML
ncbi:hypothetical protein E3P81_00218 [Wallemia ichthyophaga]|nr:hypothetical protein E3P97_00220 [Wallemia ichthyophaga]TIB50985.1 hypothetical protein E3P82_00220 [Wallemia ichthyophaga]TIB54429.1 hypothetical protein E3P81_00218 [Wallemia ichthyophaga]TIB57019.1 hypothetical protein E3P80_00220 [Wallemia ichthyophaga]